MTLESIANKTKSILSSPYFFRWVILLFSIQAVFSVLVISSSTPFDVVGGKYIERRENGVVPDGHRHLGAIYYYAERPITAGPVITDMSEKDLWMGDLERFPSYLYYYVLSFPVKAAMALQFSDTQIVWLIRLIGVAIGVLCLYTFRRIAEMATASVVVQNLSLLALALTGSFVWLSAAENYDIPALSLWLLFLYASISLFRYGQIKYLYWMALWFFFLGITKYTYIPFAGIFGLAAVVLYIKNMYQISVRSTLQQSFSDLKRWVGSLKYWRLIAGTCLIVLAGGLFSERILGNLVQYQSFNPTCTNIHSLEGCLEFGVFARNYNQKKALYSGERQPIQRDAVSYLRLWVERYYDSMYVYMGHVYIPRYSSLVELTGLATLLIGALLFLIAKKRKIRILRSQTEQYMQAAVVVLVFSQLAFNINVIVEYGGQLYAHQGRYLLSIVGFAYLLYFLLVQRSLASMKSKNRNRFIAVGVLIALFAILTTSAIPSFLIHAISSNWYSPLAQQILPEWLINHFVFW